MKILSNGTEKEITCNKCNSKLLVTDADLLTFKFSNELVQSEFKNYLHRIAIGMESEFNAGKLPYCELKCDPFYFCAVCYNEIPAATS